MKRAIISSDQNTDYSFFAPIASLFWRLRGWRPLLLLVGTVEEWLADPRSHLALKQSREVGADVHFVPAVSGHRTSTVAQCARIVGACAPGVAPDDLLITSDIDMLPLGPWVTEPKLDPAKRLHILFSNAYDQSEYPHWPMCYQIADAKTWRGITAPAHLNLGLNGAVEAALASAPKDQNDAWNWDERFLGILIVNWRPSEIQFIERHFVEGEWRIDRSDWDASLARALAFDPPLKGVTDAHLIRPGFGENWARIEPLLRAALPPTYLEWAKSYHDDWMRT